MNGSTATQKAPGLGRAHTYIEASQGGANLNNIRLPTPEILQMARSVSGSGGGSMGVCVRAAVLPAGWQEKHGGVV